MNLYQLRYFKKLAEVKHYTKTAKELFITQPTLSDSISSLERELGVSLFNKDKRQISLTKRGKEFYLYVCQALNELDTGIALMLEHSLHLRGNIEIGCIPTLLSEFLPEAIHDYKKDTKNSITFNIHNAHTKGVLNMVKSDELDLGFCSKKDSETDLIFVPILYQAFVLLVNENHPLAKEKSVTLEKLKNYDILTYRKELPICKDLVPFIEKENLLLSTTYDDEISLGGMVSTNNVAAIVANTNYLKLFNRLISIPISDIPINTHTIYMVYKNKKYIDKHIESFANYVVAKKANI